MALVKLPREFFAPSRQTNHAWSSEQESIFDWFVEGEGNLVVRARAGTGKTTTIIEGINRAPERRILLAAFNKAIADELSKRIANHNARAQTLHALGMSFCRRNIEKLEVDTKGERARTLARRVYDGFRDDKGKAPKAEFDVVSTVANLHTKIREILVDPIKDFKLTALDLVMGKVSPEMKTLGPETTAARFEALETFAVEFGFDGEEDGFWSTPQLVNAALAAVELAKEPTTQIDFADMIFLPLAHGWVTPVCDLLVVDECQDMSQAQLRLAIGATHKNGRICVVGDDRQAIYAFRGADSESLDRLKKELHATELGLKTTYRCPQAVVELAREFVPDFKVAPAAPEGEVVWAARIDKAKPGDFVLSRVNSSLIPACLELIRAGKKAYVKGAEFGREALALLDQVLAGHFTKDISIEAIGEALEAWFEKTRKQLEKKATKAKRRKLDKMREAYFVLDAFVEGALSYNDLIDKIRTTFADTAKENAVMLSTVHKAKGLEAPNVFLIANTFNHATLEEENICYVAITRAKETLHMVNVEEDDFLHGGARDEAFLAGDENDWQ